MKMKKFMAVAAALVLTLSMSMTAFAKPSAGATVTSQTPGVTAATSTVTPSKSDVKKAVEKAGVAIPNAVVVASIELTGEVPADGKVVLSFPGMTSDVKLVVMHQVNGVWEVVNATAGDGIVTLTGVTSFSPFVIVADSEAVTGGTSPKTADNGVVAAEVVAIIALAGLAVVGKKKVVR